MPNYANTIIYKLINYDYPDLIYVGSTTNFTKRKQSHKYRCNNKSINKHELKVYKIIRENGGWHSWTMIQICEYPCETKIEAIREEDRHMQELKAGLNTLRAMQTREQRLEQLKKSNLKYSKGTGVLYRLANKDKIALRTKIFFEDKDNLEKRQAYLKQYYIEHQEQDKQYRIEHKEQLKQWRLDNKDKIKQYNI